MPSNFKSPSVAGPTFAMSASVIAGAFNFALPNSVIDEVIDAAFVNTRARRGVAETFLDFFILATPQA
jgi:hypothetical protein